MEGAFALWILHTDRKTPRRKDAVFWWARVDSDHRSENATDLQSAPIGHSGTRPYYIERKWSWWTDLNPRPADYKSAALPTELHQRFIRYSLSVSLTTSILYHTKPRLSSTFSKKFSFSSIFFKNSAKTALLCGFAGFALTGTGYTSARAQGLS